MKVVLYDIKERQFNDGSIGFDNGILALRAAKTAIREPVMKTGEKRMVWFEDGSGFLVRRTNTGITVKPLGAAE